MQTQQQTVFQVDSFKSPKQWIYFCFEFDLEVCAGCRRQARKKVDSDPLTPWQCDRCEQHCCDPLAVHEAISTVIDTRKATDLHCDLCAEKVSIRDCWVSEDCQRLYCSRHLKRLECRDRVRLTHSHLNRWSGGRNGSPITANSWRQKVDSHFSNSRCTGCEFNTRAVYDGEKLIEIDRDRRLCSSAPDSLNCAGIPN